MHLVKNEHHNCMHALVATLAEHWEREYLMIFAGACRFQFTEKKEAAGTLLQITSSPIRMDYLEKYHGLRFRTLTRQPEEVPRLLEKEDSEGEYVLHTDVYHCPWCPPYQKYHAGHSVILRKKEHTPGLYTIIDPYFCDRPEVIRLDAGTLGYGGLSEFVPADFDPGATRRDFPEIIRQTARAMVWDEGNSIAAMQEFGKKIRNGFLLNIPINNTDDLNGDAFFRSMKLVSSGRMNMARLLNYYHQLIQSPACEFIGKRFERLSRNWFNVRMKLMALKLPSTEKLLNTPEKKDRAYAQISDKILGLAVEEKELWEIVLGTGPGRS